MKKKNTRRYPIYIVQFLILLGMTLGGNITTTIAQTLTALQTSSTEQDVFLPPDTFLTDTSTPVISGLTISDRSFGPSTPLIIPAENTVKPIFVHGIINHSSGCGIITHGGTIQSSLFRFPEGSCITGCSTQLSGSGCYFRNSSSTPSLRCLDNHATKFEFECRINLPYFARPSDEKGREDDYWSAVVAVTDARKKYVEQRLNFDISSLKAIDVEKITPYGNSALGSTSDKSQSIIIKNSGNTMLNSILVRGTDLVCKNGGKIPVTNQHFSLSPDVPFESMTALQGDSPSILTINLPPSTEQTTSSRNIFWKLLTPKKGLRGPCSGTVSYIAL